MHKRETEQTGELSGSERVSEFENTIEWLALSGIVIRVNALDTMKKPLDNYKNIDSFKIFVSDAGLTENYVCAQLVVNA